MNDRIRKYLQTMSYLGLFTGFAFVITIFTWSVKKYEPIVFNHPFVVNQKTVKRGEHLNYIVDYCKNTNKRPVVNRSFIDGVIYTTPDDIQPFLEEGCHQINFQIYIPRALPESEYRIMGTYTFEVNPIRTIEVNFETEKFKVIE